MSPERSFSMLFLKRRLQLAAILDSSSFRTLRTFLTSFLLTTERSPTSSLLSIGTISVRSPYETRSLKYFRLSPRNSLTQSSSMTAAPCSGWTTVSPLRNTRPPRIGGSARNRLFSQGSTGGACPANQKPRSERLLARSGWPFVGPSTYVDRTLSDRSACRCDAPAQVRASFA